MANGPDRRVKRTDRALREALYAELRERAFDEVRMTDVCERADVGRSTFYAHFADKEELLVSGFADLAGELHTHSAKHPNEELAFVRPLLDHVRGHYWIVRALGAKRSGHLVRERLLEVVTGCLLDDGALPSSHPRREATARYAAGAFVELARFWIETSPRTPLEEIATTFERMTRASIRAALDDAPHEGD